MQPGQDIAQPGLSVALLDHQTEGQKGPARAAIYLKLVAVQVGYLHQMVRGCRWPVAERP